jgi:hypothetical protein
MQGMLLARNTGRLGGAGSAGGGRVKLDGEIADVRTLDAIRIAPEVVVVVHHLEPSSRVQPDVARSIQPISAT